MRIILRWALCFVGLLCFALPVQSEVLQQTPLIHGKRQQIWVYRERPELPVLLHLHGGPGMPDSPFSPVLESLLPSTFTLVHWDQRGTGRSFEAGETLSWSLMLQDTEAMITYLRQRFHKKKIYLVGKSWGSLLGLTMAQKHPEWLHAYIGVSQIIDVSQGDAHAYAFLRQQMLPQDHAKLPEPPYRSEQWQKIRGQVQQYRGVVYAPIEAQLAWNALQSGVYSPWDYVNAYAGLQYSQRQLTPEIRRLPPFVPGTLEVPIYFFHGRHDGLVPAALAQDYLARVKAPHKAWVWFDNAAHSPNKEEPVAYQAQLKKIVEALE